MEESTPSSAAIETMMPDQAPSDAPEPSDPKQPAAQPETQKYPAAAAADGPMGQKPASETILPPDTNNAQPATHDRQPATNAQQPAMPISPPATGNVPAATDSEDTQRPIPSLFFPFSGEFPITFSFGAVSDDEAIRKQHAGWGLIGHNGVDFALPEGTDVCACAHGEIILAGDNGGYGTCVIVQHPWGTSLYGHLQECKRVVGDQINGGDLIGLSGKTGFVTGPHLHFGIMPADADEGNGYDGYIDPLPYLQSRHAEEPQATENPETDLPSAPPLPIPPPVQDDAPSNSPQPTTGNMQPATQSPTPATNNKQPIANNAYMRRLREKSKAIIEERRNRIREGILAYAKGKEKITNANLQHDLRLTQSTATNYLRDLVSRGKLRKIGSLGHTGYVLP